MESAAGGRHPRGVRQPPLLPPDSVNDSSAVRSRAGSGRRACSEACGEPSFQWARPQRMWACAVHAFTSALWLQPSRKRGRALEAAAGMCPRGAANTVPNSSHHRVCAARLVLSAALPSQLHTYPTELIPTARSLELPFRQPRAPASIPSAPRSPRVEGIAPTLFKSVSLISL